MQIRVFSCKKSWSREFISEIRRTEYTTIIQVKIQEMKVKDKQILLMELIFSVERNIWLLEIVSMYVCMWLKISIKELLLCDSLQQWL